MRRIVVFVLTSLDGAVEDPNRLFPEPAAVDGPTPPAYDPTMERLEAELISRQTAILLGRGMFDAWCRYWPTSDVQPFADFVNTTPKYVVTSSELPETPWSATSEAVGGDLPDVVARMRSLPGEGDVGVHGSIRLAGSLVAQGLVDELVLAVAPVVDPEGPRLFAAADALRRWTLTSCTPTDTGALWLTYTPATS